MNDHITACINMYLDNGVTSASELLKLSEVSETTINIVAARQKKFEK